MANLLDGLCDWFVERSAVSNASHAAIANDIKPKTIKWNNFSFNSINNYFRIEETTYAGS